MVQTRERQAAANTKRDRGEGKKESKRTWIVSELNIDIPCKQLRTQDAEADFKIRKV